MSISHFAGYQERPKFKLFAEQKRKKHPFLRVILSVVFLVIVFLAVRLFALSAGIRYVDIPVVDKKLTDFEKFVKWQVAPLFK